MKITIIQADLYWENVERNRNHLYHLIKEFATGSDIVLLPEMFTTGFTMKSKDFAESLNGPSHKWMKDLANEMKLAISGSLIIKEKGKYYNRLLFVEPGEKTWHYDKRHLFRMGDEDKHFNQGSDQVLINYRNIKIFPLICYDLRFPVWSRNKDGFDLLCYHSNWPASRDYVWKNLLKARAIENQCYVAGINRVGSDGEGVKYIGNSLLVDPKGKIISDLGNEENVETVTIDTESLEKFRKKFPVWKDADKFKIE